MSMNCIRIVLAALIVTLVPLPASAQSANSSNGSMKSKDLRSMVLKGSNTTYFKLLEMLFPDLQLDPNQPAAGIAHRTIPLRHMTENGEPEALAGKFALTDFEERWITSNGHRVLLLHLDLSAEGANGGTPYEGESTVLAAFTVEPVAKLLDAMDIKTDRFTGFLEEHPVFRLNAQNDAFVVNSTHWNAGESYNDVSVLFLDGNRFKTVTTLFLLDTQSCAETFNQTPFFRAAPRAASKYPNIIVRVQLKKEADEKECTRPTPGYTRYYQAVFSWNGTKGEYQGNARQLRALDKFNRERL